MRLRRAKINKCICTDIANYWNQDRQSEIKQLDRIALQKALQVFYHQEESKILHWAHQMVPAIGEGPARHADRYDIKRSLRRYLHQQTVGFLGVQRFFSATRRAANSDTLFEFSR